VKQNCHGPLGQAHLETGLFNELKRQTGDTWRFRPDYATTCQSEPLAHNLSDRIGFARRLSQTLVLERLCAAELARCEAVDDGNVNASDLASSQKRKQQCAAHIGTSSFGDISR
jgi:hypothetical protein